eukprot:TRINITY_DN11446_c0_g1_i1.p1 TRINITY_DN11446_c0_g1~~TRINITY_DN11446_c0_g1_i1.p1  ORF type:complete len:187 (-),score=32.71 TRINITY_DN11446_c0_g1_i1:168-728(-)
MSSRVKLQKRVQNHAGLMEQYERLIAEVVAPHLAWVAGGEMLHEELPDDQRCFGVFYQFPPTLRVHEAGSKHFRRIHRDAEYGHQPGEINFWLPLTHAGEGRASLWVEHEDGTGEFHQLVLGVGEMTRFYGVDRLHNAPPNETGSCRVSLDFRVAPVMCYDEEWSLLRKQETKICLLYTSPSPRDS